jgi:hypothetical protein
MNNNKRTLYLGGDFTGLPRPKEYKQDLGTYETIQEIDETISNYLSNLPNYSKHDSLPSLLGYQEASNEYHAAYDCRFNDGTNKVINFFITNWK